MPNTIDASQLAPVVTDHRGQGNVAERVSLIALRVALIVALITGTAWLAQALIPSAVGSLPACATESSTNCYWDAAQHGNGIGVPFVNFDGQNYYTEATR